MKKIFLILTLVAIGLSGCLKDPRAVDLADAGNIVNMPLSGVANFGRDAVLSDPDTIKFAVDYATANPNKALTVTLAVDTTLVASYNAANPAIKFLAMPANAYTFTQTTVSIPAGAQYAFTTIIFNKSVLDPSKSYMLPVKIASAQGVPISSNFGVHYYHVVGNDFAGTWRQTFRRWNASDSTSAPLNGASFANQPTTFVPISPTEFTVKSGYANYLVSYDVTFTKNADGTYSNFAVQILPSDDAVLTTNLITLAQQPVFLPSPPNATSYTYAQAIKLFYFQWEAATSSTRYLVDQYYK
jgi:hypothetical protein